MDNATIKSSQKRTSCISSISLQMNVKCSVAVFIIEPSQAPTQAIICFDMIFWISKALLAYVSSPV